MKNRDVAALTDKYVAQDLCARAHRAGQGQGSPGLGR